MPSLPRTEIDGTPPVTPTLPYTCIAVAFALTKGIGTHGAVPNSAEIGHR